MRIRLKFLLKKQELTLEYRKLILHYIKTSLENLEEIDGYTEFYGDKLINRGFTFAVKLPKPIFLKDKIKLDNNEIEVNISTSDAKKTLIFNNAFSKMLFKEKDIGNDNFIILRDIYLQDGKKINQNEVTIKMLSPLCIREHFKGQTDYYYSVKHKDFSVKFAEIVEKQLKAINIESNVEVIPLDSNKTVVNHYNQKIECSIGFFVLRGQAVALQSFYDNGIGSKKSQGFGMVEII